MSAAVVRETARRRSGRLLRRAARAAGFDLLRRNFYSPVPQLETLPAAAFDRRSPMPGIAFEMDRYEAFLADLAPFLAEFKPPDGFHWGNGMYGPVESEVLYGLIRREKPRRVVELGSGFSSLIIAAACRRNAAEGSSCRYVAFDPYPRDFVTRGIEGMESVDPVPATEVPGEEFEGLADGDVLFVDTTHTVKIGGDVNRIVLEIVPTLAPGVFVHFHDVLLPYEYPRGFFEKNLYWQEQYLLQALLAENPRLEIVFPANAVARERPDLIERTIPNVRLPFGPGAFWIRRTDATR